jgi:hypothetical protein
MKSAIKCQCCVSYSCIMLSINGIVPLPGMSYNTDYQIQKMHSNHVLAVLTRWRNGHSRTTYEHHTKCIYCNKRVTQIPHGRNSSKIQWKNRRKKQNCYILMFYQFHIPRKTNIYKYKKLHQRIIDHKKCYQSTCLKRVCIAGKHLNVVQFEKNNKFNGYVTYWKNILQLQPNVKLQLDMYMYKLCVYILKWLILHPKIHLQNFFVFFKKIICLNL